MARRIAAVHERICARMRPVRSAHSVLLQDLGYAVLVVLSREWADFTLASGVIYSMLNWLGETHGVIFQLTKPDASLPWISGRHGLRMQALFSLCSLEFQNRRLGDDTCANHCRS